MTSKSYMDIHVNYPICHSYVVIGVTQKTSKLFARQRHAVSSFSFILRPPTAWVFVWNRGLSQRAPRSAIKPSTRLLNNQIHKAKWKLDTTLHKTVLLSEAKIETIANLMTSAIIPPITSGSSQEMIHYDWQIQVLPLNFQTRHKWTCKLFFFKFVPKYRIRII